MSANSSTHTAEQPDKIWTRDFVLICFANLFIFLGFQMTLPTLPLFVKELGGSDQMIGVIVGVFTVSAVLLTPYAGIAVELKGIPVVYVCRLRIFLFSVGAQPFVSSILFSFIMPVVQRTGLRFTTTATGTIATDLIPPKRRGQGAG